MAKASAILAHGWKLGDTIGSGGQAAVHRATKKDTDSPEYAVKVLKNVDSKQAYSRFQAELAALQKLDHPSIVKVIDYKVIPDEKLCFYVMELVEGAIAFKDIIGKKEGPFYANADASLVAFVKILGVLQACKNARIVHRDLHPGNVLYIPTTHEIKIIDFGCCHIEDGGVVTLTDEGVGAPLYRAPECAGHTTDEPQFYADLYSAGKILWSIVTSKRVFEREKPVFNALSMPRMLPEPPNDMASTRHLRQDHSQRSQKPLRFS